MNNRNIHRCKNNLRFGVISLNSSDGIVGDIIAQCCKCGALFIVPEHREIYPASPDSFSTSEIKNIQWLKEEKE